MSRKKLKITGFAVVLVAASASGLQAKEAGSLLGRFKELLVNSGTAMENTTKNYWGPDGLGASLIPSLKGDLGNGGWKGKGLFLDGTFKTLAEKQMAAQNQALTDVKAVLTSVMDIVLWLPRKIRDLFAKLMGKIEDFVGKLDAMNQGGSVKERFGNLVGGGGGGGGDAEAAPASFGGGDFGGGSAGTIGDELDGALESVDAGARASESALPDITGTFPALLGAAIQIEDPAKRKEALRRLRVSYVELMKKALAKGSNKGVGMLWNDREPFYRLSPTWMHNAVTGMAKELKTPVSVKLAKQSGRIVKAMELHQD